MSLLSCACSKEKNISDLTAASKPYLQKQTDSNSGHKAETEKDICKSRSNPVMSAATAQQCQPNHLQYELSAVIGKGHMDVSTISLAKHIPSNTLVAVKRINLDVWEKELSYFQNEILLTQQLSHANILPIYCSFINQQELWAVMPLMAFGSCRDLIHAYFSSGLPEQAIVFILREVLQALEYLHTSGVIHRGIKASHVMIAKNGQVCLTGLHNCFTTFQSGKRLRKVHDWPEHTVDCLHWYSPELLEQNLAGYNTKSDVYSIGILTCELANGQAPFSDMPPTQMLLERLNGTKPRLADSTTVGEFVIDDDENGEQTEDSCKEKADAIFFQRTFSPHLHEFSSICLEKDPSARPSASQLLNHPVFKTTRNHSTSMLPSLLQPVTPLTDIARVPRDMTSEEEDFTRKMSEVSMDEEWTF